MPFKHYAAHRHQFPRAKYRVTNWATYEASLRQRGSLTIWFSEEGVQAWRAAPRTTRGGQPRYSAVAIETALTLRALFHLAFRQTEGLIGSLMQLLRLDLLVPDHTTLSRRARTLAVRIRPQTAGPLHLLVDSTGLKLSGPGEWLVEKHGSTKRRSWRKFHVGVAAGTGQIVAVELTTPDIDDASQVGPLLNQVSGPVEVLIGDGAYDRTDVYAAVAARHPAAEAIAPPRSDAVLSATADTAPTQRDRHIQAIAETGRMAWQRTSGYNARAKAEAAIARYKQVIGDRLRAHSDDGRRTEVIIAGNLLNRMFGLERPNYVRVL
ncbi:IS5 family transposase [Azospirillum brasilense]|uniref:IS5 family transposase n=1 Tax=Azospirillum brasilense TaxID=192 RepID=UPI00157BADFB|nr:IS5 family transposase [Azospirillum brasilense]NUB25787.1 IS5 family transposase [Azospirillum brasilense]NUB31471.1 IS5 family transposase [Azospirillum brasilense]